MLIQVITRYPLKSNGTRRAVLVHLQRGVHIVGKGRGFVHVGQARRHGDAVRQLAVGRLHREGVGRLALVVVGHAGLGGYLPGGTVYLEGRRVRSRQGVGKRIVVRVGGCASVGEPLGRYAVVQ